MPRARVKYSDGLQFIGEADSGHAIVMDGDAEVGGNDTGLRPTELLLIATGGCSGMDVISILKKKRQAVTSLEIQVNGEKADNHPKRFTAIDIEFIVRGRNIAEEAVERAVQLSMDKYCSVKASLEGTANINYSYKIIQE